MNKKHFPKLLVLMMLVPGPALCLVYNLVASHYNFHLGFNKEKVNLSIVISTFSFTMLGFMATVITLITVMSERLHFQKYRKKGFLESFFMMYFVAIGNLFATFIAAIFNFAVNRPQFLFDLMMALCINSLLQTFFVGAIIFNLLKHSYKDATSGSDSPLGPEPELPSADDDEE